MDFKLLVAILVVYATTLWSVGNSHPMIRDGNIDMSSDKILDEFNEYPDGIKDIIPKSERKPRELGMWV